MYRVAFYVDGSMHIGMGHVMRCISLAKEYDKKGWTVYFYSKYEEGINKIQAKGFAVIKRESADLKDFLTNFDIDLLVIDSYKVDVDFFLRIKPFVKKICYIDDLNKFIYPVDILINGNITGEYMNYMKYSEEEIMLLGPKYNLIRAEFKHLPERKIDKEINTIMITTGGSDPYNLNARILQDLSADSEFNNIKFNVIVGNAFKNQDELAKISLKNPNINLLQNVKRMSEVMLASDIVISAGGSTLYELCACGTPTLAFIMADNQELIVQKMNESGYIKSLGWYNQISGETLVKAVKEMKRDYKLRVKLSGCGQKLVDARGVERIVERMENLL